MRVGIIGSRKIDTTGVMSKINDILEGYSNGEYGSLTYVTGTAPGLDEEVMTFSRNAGIDWIGLRPYHLLDKHVEFNPKYFFVRNKQIIENSDLCIFAWSGAKDEVESAINYAKRLDKEYAVIKTEAM